MGRLVHGTYAMLQMITKMLLALSLATLSSAAKPQYCGGRSVMIPLLGEFSFWLTLEPESNEPAGEDSFAFRSDGDLHVPWCLSNPANFETGNVTLKAACLTDLLSKYRIEDFHMNVSGMPERLVLSATAAPLGMSLGTFEVNLSQQQCNQQ